MKEKMKKIVKGMTVTAIAVSVILGSVMATPVKAEAKGTAFINKKVSSVTPTIKSAKRSKDGYVTITVTVPKSKVKKLGRVYTAEVAYGSTKNSKKFEAKKMGANVTKKGKNQYIIKIRNNYVARRKNLYISVRFIADVNSNWSKLHKVSGKRSNYYEWWGVRCNGCGKCWEGEDHEALIKLCLKHQSDSRKAWDEKYGPQIHSIEDEIRLLKEHPCRCGHASYSDYGGGAYSYSY